MQKQQQTLTNHSSKKTAKAIWVSSINSWTLRNYVGQWNSSKSADARRLSGRLCRETLDQQAIGWGAVTERWPTSILDPRGVRQLCIPIVLVKMISVVLRLGFGAAIYCICCVCFPGGRITSEKQSVWRGRKVVSADSQPRSREAANPPPPPPPPVCPLPW